MSQPNQGMEMDSVKIGPAGYAFSGSVWSLKGLSEIVQIRISYDIDSPMEIGTIRSLQFEYFKDGQLGISDTIGNKSFGGQIFRTITLDYPSEYITGVEGASNGSGWLQAISIETNRNTYGPFGYVGSAYDEFSYKFGPKNQLGGFHGTENGDGVKSIGIYLNPVSLQDPDSVAGV